MFTQFCRSQGHITNSVRGEGWESLHSAVPIPPHRSSTCDRRTQSKLFSSRGAWRSLFWNLNDWANIPVSVAEMERMWTDKDFLYLDPVRDVWYYRISRSDLRSQGLDLKHFLEPIQVALLATLAFRHFIRSEGERRRISHGSEKRTGTTHPAAKADLGPAPVDWLRGPSSAASQFRADYRPLGNWDSGSAFPDYSALVGLGREMVARLPLAAFLIPGRPSDAPTLQSPDERSSRLPYFGAINLSGCTTRFSMKNSIMC